MFRTYICLTEQHTTWVVPLAAIVCWFSIHTSLRLIQQSRASQGVDRWLWLAAAGFSAGAGVWSTHFIGMLGYDPGVVIGYETPLTLISLSVSVLSSVSTLAVLRQVSTMSRAAAGGACFGLGVGAMHFSGMAGVLLPGALIWVQPFVLASLLIGAALAAAGFAAFVRLHATYRTEIAATLLTAAIAGLHFTAMSAVEIIPDATLDDASPNIPRLSLAFSIAAAMLTILGFGILALFAERMQRANQALRASEQRFRLLAENTTDVIIWCDLDTTRKYVSPSVRTVLGYEPEELVGTRPLESVHPDEAHAFGRLLDELTSGRVDHAVASQRYRRKDGEYIWVEISFSLTRDRATNRQDGYVASMRDVMARKEAELQIAHMAMHDALTGLPNRLLFRDRLTQELANARRYGSGFAVLACDLDRFKAVNDTLGHPAGDKLLCAVAERLRMAVRDVDTVARLGGDEFAIILLCLDNLQAVSVVADRVIESLGQPIDLDGTTSSIGVSIGIALGTARTDDADSLFKNADIALYRAKAAGRNTFRFYEAGMDAVIATRHDLELDMRAAIQRGGFVLHYQPVIALATNATIGFEALLRWEHPLRGAVSPAEFIPLAEETGLIVSLGAWALREACHEAVSWPDDVRVAVNVSVVQFQQAGLEQSVMSALAMSGLAPHRLELEITESVLVQDAEAVIACLHRLRSVGVRIALDDFGTGYSSLSYLRRFPFDKIKIDRSFIREIDDPDAAAIVRAVVGLGTHLGTAITAEGIETQEQLDQVRKEGCTEVQGFLISKPLSALDALNFVKVPTSAAA